MSEVIRRTECRGWGYFTYESHDGGKTWKFVSSESSEQRGHREMQAYEQHRIQRELK